MRPFRLFVLTICVALTTSMEAFAYSKQHIESIAGRIARSEGIAVPLVLAVIRVESAFNYRAQSHAGAQGLMQLMPATARELGVSNSFNPEANIRGGCRYLRYLIRRFNDVRVALWAYNAGPTRVQRGDIPSMTRRYAEKVLRFYWYYVEKGGT